MRAVLVTMILGCAAGCGSVPGSDPPWIDPGGPIVYQGGCEKDGDCSSGQVCARIGGCTAAEDVRAVHVNWTLTGKPANATTCADTPDLTLRLSQLGGSGPGWAPVPCKQGRFTVDKMPSSYTQVELSPESRGDAEVSALLDPATGEVTVDLPL